MPKDSSFSLLKNAFFVLEEHEHRMSGIKANKVLTAFFKLALPNICVYFILRKACESMV